VNKRASLHNCSRIADIFFILKYPERDVFIMSTNGYHPPSNHSRQIDYAQQIANNIRMRVFEHVLANNGGYLSQACSSAETLATLYTMVMNLGESTAPADPQPFDGVPGPDNPDYFNGGAYNGPRAPHYDRFIFSPAHYALVLYSVLIEVGRLSPNALDLFNKDGYTIEMIGAEHSPGVESTTGSLAQAISQAGGVALGRRLKGEPGRVWIYMSDGELQEGQTWEAIQAMCWYKLDNVGIFVDMNGQQCDGQMAAVMNIEPAAARLEAFGARVFEVDGHDIEALYHPTTLQPDGRPLVVLARTDPTRGIPLLKERAPKLHTVKFKSSEERERYRLAYHMTKRLYNAKRKDSEAPMVEMDAGTLDAIYDMMHQVKAWKEKAASKTKGIQLLNLDLDELDAIVDSALNLEED
jgi:transketolase